MFFEKDKIVQRAEEALATKPESITMAVAPLSEGTPHDYFSQGNYWWPNPDTPDGLPYIRKDGQSYPHSFEPHRLMTRRVRTRVARLAAGYQINKNPEYAAHAAKLLKTFFLDAETRMNPNLLYGQAIPGICSGRGIGIIDTLSLVEVPVAVRVLANVPSFPDDVTQGVIAWFADYLHWMRTHPYGVDEMNTTNNHSVCWFLQAAVFARFTDDEETLRFCRDAYRNRLLREQMALDGSFPRELERTKPYAYSIFVLDNLLTLCHVLSEDGENEWRYKLPDGRGAARAMDYLLPFLEDKSKWPYAPDVQDFEDWPVAMAGFLFGGLALDRPRYIALWQILDPDPVNMEIRRNMAIREPSLWLPPNHL